MPEQQKRIIVDGVDFPQVFQFPRMLRPVTMAMQPARMVVALLMVTALVTIGKLWDDIAPATVSPAGLLHGTWRSEVDGPALQTVLRNAMLSFTAASAPAVGGGTSVDLDAPTVLARMREDYETRRVAMTSPAEQQQIDERYSTWVGQVTSLMPRGVFEATSAQVTGGFRQIVQGVLSLDPKAVAGGLSDVLIFTPRELWRNHRWFTVIYGLFALAVFAVGGGAISRMTAQQIATAQRMSVRESLDFSVNRLPAFFAAQAMPLLLLLLACAIIMVMGVLMAAPVLDVIGGIVYGVALIVGFIVAFLLIGYALGHPMLVPAVACENCGGADAMQRAYAYVVTRPLHLLVYWVVGLIGLALGFLLVSLFATLMLNCTASLYSTLVSNPAMGVAGGHEVFSLNQASPAPPLPVWHHRWAANIIDFWETLMMCLVGAYVLSYHFSASTVGYLLMRRVADGQEVEEIWQPGLIAGTLTPTPAATSVSITTVAVASVAEGGETAA